MEGQAAKISDGSERMSFIGGQNALCVILNDHQMVAPRDIQNRVHLAGYTGVMHHRDHTCFVRDGILNLPFIYIHRVRTDVHKDRNGMAQHKAVRRRDKRIGRHDHFLALSDTGQMRCHLQCACAGCRQKHPRSLCPLLQPRADLLCEFAVAADFAVDLCRLFQALHLRSRIGRNIERNHGHASSSE